MQTQTQTTQEIIKQKIMTSSNLYNKFKLEHNDDKEFHTIFCNEIYNLYKLDEIQLNKIINDTINNLSFIENNFERVLDCLNYLQINNLNEIIEIVVCEIFVKKYNKDYKSYPIITNVNYDLQKLIRKHCCINSKNCCKTQGYAIKRCHIGCLTYFLDVKKEKCIKLSLKWACEKNLFNIVKYLSNKCNNSCIIDAIEYTASTGYLNIIEFLYKKVRTCTEITMHNAIKNGHLNIVKYLFEEKNEKVLLHSIVSAAANGFLDIIMYFFDNHLDKNISNYHNLPVKIKYITDDIINIANNYNHIDIIDYLKQIS